MDLVRVAPQLPEEILPLEVWGLILDHLRSPSDLINCNQTCKAWARLLELRKTTFLMPQVFPLLYKYLGHTRKANEESESEDEDEDYVTYKEKESEREYAKLNTVLQMRLVSHSWKESVDTYYQDHDARNGIGFSKQIEDEDDEPSEIPIRPYTFSVDNLAKLETWVSKDFPPDCNPFITRYVVYKEDSQRYEYLEADDDEHEADLERLQPQLRTSFKTLLESFGSQIWTVRLSFCGSDSSRIELYRLVRSYLILMPNLKAIYIDDELEENGGSFEELLRKEPMPALGHLKILDMSPITCPISIGILCQNPKLRKLSVYGRFEEVVPLYILRGFGLSELEQLRVGSLHSKVDLGQVQNLVCENLRGFKLFVEGKQLKDVFGAVSASSFSSSLEHLILTVWNFPDPIENDLELEHLEQQLEQPERLIEDLEQPLRQLEPPEQQLGQPEQWLEQPEQKLNLRKLKKLQFSILVPFELETIDFLLGCPELQEIDLDLKIFSKSKEDNTSNSVIQFKGYIASMQDSNIWQLLPMLRRLEIKTTEMEVITRGCMPVFLDSGKCYTFVRG